MKELAVRDLINYLGISKERVWRMIHIGRIKTRRQYQGKFFTYLTSTEEAERIKEILENPKYCYPTNCVVCGKLFERMCRRIHVCPECLSIKKECDCGCGAIISKYYRKAKDGKPVIKKFARGGHAFKNWHRQVREDPKLWQQVSDARRERWQDPEFQQRQYEGRLKTSRVHLARIRNGERTDIETMVDDELVRLGIEFEPNYKFYTYWIDCALVSKKIAIEVDGTYYHSLPRTQKYDGRKDAFLLKNGWQVIRLKGTEIRENVQKVVAEKVLPLLS